MTSNFPSSYVTMTSSYVAMTSSLRNSKFRKFYLCKLISTEFHSDYHLFLPHQFSVVDLVELTKKLGTELCHHLQKGRRCNIQSRNLGSIIFSAGLVFQFSILFSCDFYCYFLFQNERKFTCESLMLSAVFSSDSVIFCTSSGGLLSVTLLWHPRHELVHLV
jgi:hypothetical protein